MECCGKAAAFVLRIRLAAPTFSHSPNLLCRFTSCFARSVWKTERLWTERLWSAAAKPQLSCCEFAWPRRLALVRRTCCVGSHVASLAQFGKLTMECCGKAAAFVLRIRLAAPTLFHSPNLLCRFTSCFARSVWKTDYGVLRQSRSFRAANSPGRADLLSFAELIVSVHTLLRSLSLEN